MQRELGHTETLLRRSSPSRKLKEIEDSFKGLKDEFSRVIDYKLERFIVSLPELKKQYRQTHSFLLEQKVHYLEYMEKKMMMNNPKDQCRTGWAKVSVEGKTIALSSLEMNKKFLLEDEFSKVEAVCISQSSFLIEL